MSEEVVRSGRYPWARKGVLYSMGTGSLAAYPGEVKLVGKNSAIFAIDDTTLLRQCAVEPGVMYNAMIWLEERDDEVAKKILIAYEYEQIKKLREKIKNHLRKVTQIRVSK